MKLQNAITFDDLEEIWLFDDETPADTEIVLPEEGENTNVNDL